MLHSTPAILTCAVSGEGPIHPDFPDFPITPERIAAEVVAAAKAGASMVHCHVRDPKTGQGSHDPKLYKELSEHVRASGVDVVFNLTCGGNADYIPEPFDSANPGPLSTVASVDQRVQHIEECRPDVASLDVTTMNDADMVYLNTAPTLRAMAQRFRKAGVKPEIEVFGAGDLELAKDMIDRGLIDGPPMIQFVLGVPWGMPCTPETIMYMKSLLPEGAVWGMLGIGRNQMPVAALAAVLGGNVRVGLEDNLYLSKGVWASNAELVTRGKALIEGIGRKVATPDEAREILGLRS